MTAESGLALVVALLLVLTGLYLRGLAGRLDRLHLRVDAASAALETHAWSSARPWPGGGAQRVGSTRPVRVLLLDAAPDRQARVRGADRMARDRRARATSPQPCARCSADAETRRGAAGRPRRPRPADRARRREPRASSWPAGSPTTPRRAAVAVRRRGLVRALHLAGHAPWPQSRDLDDAPPEALAEFALRLRLAWGHESLPVVRLLAGRRRRGCCWSAAGAFLALQTPTELRAGPRVTVSDALATPHPTPEPPDDAAVRTPRQGRPGAGRQARQHRQQPPARAG